MARVSLTAPSPTAGNQIKQMVALGRMLSKPEGAGIAPSRRRSWAYAAILVESSLVLNPVAVNGATFDGMYVDGGTGPHVFVYPAAVNWRA